MGAMYAAAVAQGCPTHPSLLWGGGNMAVPPYPHTYGAYQNPADHNASMQVNLGAGLTNDGAGHSLRSAASSRTDTQPAPQGVHERTVSLPVFATASTNSSNAGMLCDLSVSGVRTAGPRPLSNRGTPTFP